MPIRLVDRHPQVSPDALVSGLVPPPLFRAVSFDTYRPDPDQPTQRAALTALREFSQRVSAPPSSGRGLLRRRPAEPVSPGGVYLDGGFGVGKTHLLASLWHAAPGPKAYATFVELTHLAGALGFHGVVEALSPMRLLAVDEFELDDPGDTVLVSTLLARLTERGVALAATSNTLPEALGEGRFASEDFLREIQALASRFTSVRVDGPDYRHRGLPEPVPPLSDDAVRSLAEHTPNASLDDFTELCQHLITLHPSRYGALVEGVGLVAIREVRPVPDEATALRVVVLADRLYDRQIPIAASGVPFTEVFTAPMLAGGYRKKYLRAVSRLLALTRAVPGAE
ncbi:MAG: cell division protein ZapE [Pseudonocardiales bacterium]|nr:cell division protein ZapE [Pseudonocardiales bacterium]